MKNYRKDCLYYFSIDGMCGRLIDSYGKAVPCDHICDCPWFKPIQAPNCIYYDTGYCTKALPGVVCNLSECVAFTEKEKGI